MSRHLIELPANLPAGNAGVVCGYDRHPYEHFYCNVSESLTSDHIDEPIWASILSDGFECITNPDGFDEILASMGIKLPLAYKQALAADWTASDMRRAVQWSASGAIVAECI